MAGHQGRNVPRIMVNVLFDSLDLNSYSIHTDKSGMTVCSLKFKNRGSTSLSTLSNNPSNQYQSYRKISLSQNQRNLRRMGQYNLNAKLHAEPVTQLNKTNATGESHSQTQVGSPGPGLNPHAAEFSCSSHHVEHVQNDTTSSNSSTVELDPGIPGGTVDLNGITTEQHDETELVDTGTQDELQSLHGITNESSKIDVTETQIDSGEHFDYAEYFNNWMKNMRVYWDNSGEVYTTCFEKLFLTDSMNTQLFDKLDTGVDRDAGSFNLKMSKLDPQELSSAMKAAEDMQRFMDLFPPDSDSCT